MAETLSYSWKSTIILHDDKPLLEKWVKLINQPFEMMAKDFQGYFYCFLFGSDFRSDVQLRHLLKVPSMLRMMRKMIQHEYVFSLQIGDVETSRGLMYIFIWKTNHHFFIEKVYHHPKEPHFYFGGNDFHGMPM